MEAGPRWKRRPIRSAPGLSPKKRRRSMKSLWRERPGRHRYEKSDAGGDIAGGRAFDQLLAEAIRANRRGGRPPGPTGRGKRSSGARRSGGRECCSRANAAGRTSKEPGNSSGEGARSPAVSRRGDEESSDASDAAKATTAGARSPRAAIDQRRDAREAGIDRARSGAGARIAEKKTATGHRTDDGADERRT